MKIFFLAILAWSFITVPVMVVVVLVLAPGSPVSGLIGILTGVITVVLASFTAFWVGTSSEL